MCVLIFSAIVQGQHFGPPPMQQINRQISNQMMFQQTMMQQQQMLRMMQYKTVSNEQKLQREVSKKEKIEIKIKELEAILHLNDGKVNKMVSNESPNLDIEDYKAKDKTENITQKIEKLKKKLQVSSQKIDILQIKIDTNTKEIEALKKKEEEEKLLKEQEKLKK